MYKRKLLALDYPQPDNFEINNESQVRALILWLEDQKIRHMKIEDRAGLRDVTSPKWSEAFQQYLTELCCPYDASKEDIVIDWLLGYAVRLEYGDDVDKYKSVNKGAVENAKNRQAGQSSNPLDALNFDDADFKAGVASLAMLMQVPPHQDHLQQLKAISLIVGERLSKDSLQSAAKKSDDKSKKADDHIPLDKTELGFEAGDYIMTEAAKIVRLLHLKELRDLQTKINAAIVAVQAITADPKTDSRLGKVGR